jgi:anti-sigma regulatory factor (Ser/Thr protein kinase)
MIVPAPWSVAQERRVIAAAALRFPHHPRSVRDARLHLRFDLLEAGVDSGTVENAELVLTELLGNAVRHARPLQDGGVAVSWKVRDGVVDVTVTDGGSSRLVARRAAPPMATGGRGLQMVSAVARAWGVVDGRRSRTVWAALVPAEGARPSF